MATHADYSESKKIERFVVLVAVNSAANNNKMYRINWYTDGTAQGFNGRVGSTTVPQKLMSWHEAEAKKREKLDKGYRETEVVADTAGTVNSAAATVISTKPFADVLVQQVANGNRELAALIHLLVDRNRHNIAGSVNSSTSYNVNTGQWSTPVGVIGPNAVNEARTLLARIGGMVARNDFGYVFDGAVENYMSLIPMNIGRGRWTPRGVLGDTEQIAAQEALLDGLEASITAARVVSAPTTQYKLALAIAQDAKRKEWQHLYATSSARASHYTKDWRIKAAYEVDLPAMTAAYRAMPDGGLRLLLWHSTNVGNVLSILLNGFRIPTAITNGWAYGPGIYFSNVGSKSTQYCGGGESFSFLCHVNMGRPFELRSLGAHGTPREVSSGRYDSTWAVGSLDDPTSNGVRYNEMIVHQTSRVMPVGLVHWN